MKKERLELQLTKHFELLGPTRKAVGEEQIVEHRKMATLHNLFHILRGTKI